MSEHDGYAPVRPRDEDDQRVVTVCSACLCASCWNGLFMCDQSANAGTVDKPVAELRALNREHSDWWDPESYVRVADPLWQGASVEQAVDEAGVGRP